MNFGERWAFLLGCVFVLFTGFNCYAEQAIEGIDKIYLINLDKRADRLASAQNTLAPYGIIPSRFSAINGHELSYETLMNSALPCPPEFRQRRWMTTPIRDGALGYVFGGTNPYQPVFCEWMSIGAVGCALSHLSILQEAYDNGYEAIWVLEDDILVEKDPRLLAGLIKKLDILTHGDWDVLYTDMDATPASQPFWWMWRPDFAAEGTERFSYQEAIDTDFIHIGSRTRTHSMIIRRSGMKKLLDHFETNRLFLPYDHEIAFAKDINLYMLAYPLVTFNPKGDSDIQKLEPVPSIEICSDWKECKKDVLNHLSDFEGWCSAEKAVCLMDFIYRHKPALCVEIGAFGGSTTYPILSALNFVHKGHLHAIDAWSNVEAVRGFTPGDSNYIWWASYDFYPALKNLIKKLIEKKLRALCTLTQDTSRNAVKRFADKSIDFLYLDGNASEKGSLDDVISYLPKVKSGGCIWLNDAHAPAKNLSLVYLAEHATFMPEESLHNRCVVFKKH